MPSRITQTLAQLKSQGQKAFAAYIVAGDPDLATTEKLIPALEAAGANIIELGVPFSDPMADGPVIQQASERALKNGVTLAKIFSLVGRVRVTSQIPILLMGYYNPVLQFGLKKFATEARRAGVDGVLLVDLPAEESRDLQQYLKPCGIDMIFLLTPTSDASRVALVQKRGSGFIYYVSITGVTGACHLDSKSVAKHLTPFKKSVTHPILIGFGISKPEQVRLLSPLADGVVVGSVILKTIAESPRQEITTNVSRLVTILAKGLYGNP